MPDKQIIDLPALDELKDTDYLVVGRPSAPEPAQKMQGAQLVAFVDKSAQPHVTEAAKQAQAAAASAQTATTKASEASKSATQAQNAQQEAAIAKTAAEAAQAQAGQSATAAAQAAQEAIENLGMSAQGLPEGSQPEVTKSVIEGIVSLTFKIPAGATGPEGPTGPQGVSVDRVEKTSGTGEPGTTDTYTIYLTDGSSYPFQVLNGPQGPQGNGLTIKYTYDTLGELEAAVPSPERGMNAYIGTGAPYDLYTYTQTSSGNQWTNVGPLQGPTGADGQSAYEAAQAGGYTGSESQFNADLAGVSSKQRVVDLGIVSTSGNSIFLSGEQINQIFSDETPPILIFNIEGSSDPPSFLVPFLYSKDSQRCTFYSAGPYSSGNNGNSGFRAACFNIYDGVLYEGTTGFTITDSSAEFTVPVQLPADPTQPLEAATKQYVDNAKVDLSKAKGTLSIANGGTGVTSMTGTDYGVNRPRGIVLQSSTPSSVPNGCIVGVYE